MKEVVTTTEEFNQLDAIGRIHEDFSGTVSVGETNIRTIIQSLIDSVWHYSFMHYFTRKKNRNERSTVALRNEPI